MGERCPLPRAKVIDAQTEVKAAGQELEEKKAEVTDAETSSQRLRMPQFRMQKMTSRWNKAYVTIRKNKVREAEAAHDQVVEAVRQQENQVTASGIFGRCSTK